MGGLHLLCRLLSLGLLLLEIYLRTLVDFTGGVEHWVPYNIVFREKPFFFLGGGGGREGTGDMDFLIGNN